ncbi:hypothetical protein Y032_0055g2547 [Ancylostoma ceylanicum]|nr:hypothetical protein Y032_0055g2547 [Ancylostoma ceylanicum]
MFLPWVILMMHLRLQLLLNNILHTFDFEYSTSNTLNIRMYDEEKAIQCSKGKAGQCEKGFRRLTKDQPVGLKYIGIVLSVVKEVTDATGFVQELTVRASPLTEQNKPKAFVHWVSCPATAEVRLYDRLVASVQQCLINHAIHEKIIKGFLVVFTGCFADKEWAGGPEVRGFGKS